MSGSGREVMPDVRERSGGPLECPGVVERPTWMSGIGRQTNSDVRKWSEDARKCEGVVGRPSRMSGSGGKPFRMSGSGRETLPAVCEWWEALLDVRK